MQKTKSAMDLLKMKNKTNIVIKKDNIKESKSIIQDGDPENNFFKMATKFKYIETEV